MCSPNSVIDIDTVLPPRLKWLRDFSLSSRPNSPCRTTWWSPFHRLSSPQPSPTPQSRPSPSTLAPTPPSFRQPRYSTFSVPLRDRCDPPRAPSCLRLTERAATSERTFLELCHAAAVCLKQWCIYGNFILNCPHRHKTQEGCRLCEGFCVWNTKNKQEKSVELLPERLELSWSSFSTQPTNQLQTSTCLKALSETIPNLTVGPHVFSQRLDVVREPVMQFLACVLSCIV